MSKRGAAAAAAAIGCARQFLIIACIASPLTIFLLAKSTTNVGLENRACIGCYSTQLSQRMACS